MIRFITYVGAWKRATIEGFTFVRGEYLGIPKRLAERILLNADFAERPAAHAPAPAPVLVEPEVVPTEEPTDPAAPLDDPLDLSN